RTSSPRSRTGRPSFSTIPAEFAGELLIATIAVADWTPATGKRFSPGAPPSIRSTATSRSPSNTPNLVAVLPMSRTTIIGGMVPAAQSVLARAGAPGHLVHDGAL